MICLSGMTELKVNSSTLGLSQHRMQNA